MTPDGDDSGLEAVLVEAAIDRLPDQAGDVPQTWANIEKAKRLLGYEPRTPFADGLRHFAEWMSSVSTKG